VRSGRWAEAAALLVNMQEDGIRRSVSLLTSVVEACEAQQQWNEALRLLDELGEVALEPFDGPL